MYGTMDWVAVTSYCKLAGGQNVVMTYDRLVLLFYFLKIYNRYWYCTP